MTAARPRRGIATIADVKARCIVDPLTGCWHWQGARSCAKGGKPALPTMHTFDPRRGEKRVMSGPLAVWCIAHGEAPNAPLVYRGCGCDDCLNPVHLRLARSHAEIGLHQRRSGSRKGKNTEQRRANMAKGRQTRGIVETPAEVVLAIRAAPETVTGRALARLHGVSESTVSKIRLGRSRVDVAPPRVDPMTGRAWGAAA